MPPIAVIVAAVGFLVVFVPMFRYFASIGREEVPEDPTPYNVAMAVGAVLGIAGIALAPALTTGLLGGLAIALAGFFVWLMSMRRLPDGALIARVGEPLPELEAPDQDGALIRLADLRGQRVLLKFFRGGW